MCVCGDSTTGFYSGSGFCVIILPNLWGEEWRVALEPVWDRASGPVSVESHLRDPSKLFPVIMPKGTPTGLQGFIDVGGPLRRFTQEYMCGASVCVSPWCTRAYWHTHRRKRHLVRVRCVSVYEPKTLTLGPDRPGTDVYDVCKDVGSPRICVGSCASVRKSPHKRCTS